MKFTTVASALLLASTAVAAPTLKERLRERRAERLAKRAGARQKGLRPLAVNFTSLEDTISSDNPEFVTYSSNWAGAVVVSSDITEVTGTFNVPTVSEPSGGSSNTEYGAAAWVGIDGDTCQTGMSRLILR
jgi:hypothetical protein